MITDGLKHDGGKPRCDLVPGEIIEAIGAVRTYGVQKYGKEYSYRQVEPKRYRAALMRHICAWLRNPFGVDEESGLPHLWHVACNVAFLLELDKETTDKAEIGHFRGLTKKIKTEAYKEFAERLKVVAYVPDLSIVGEPVVDVEDIDDLVKELTEVSDNAR